MLVELPRVFHRVQTLTCSIAFPLMFARKLGLLAVFLSLSYSNYPSSRDSLYYRCSHRTLLTFLFPSIEGLVYLAVLLGGWLSSPFFHVYIPFPYPCREGSVFSQFLSIHNISRSACSIATFFFFSVLFSSYVCR